MKKEIVMPRKSSPPVTAEMAGRIKFLLKKNELNQHDIAALYGINQGRISEIKKGQRFPDVPPAQGSFAF
mgnify:CR=1 FL=1